MQDNIMASIADPRAFILANTRLTPVPHVPEVVLHVADEPVPLWEKTEDELREIALNMETNGVYLDVVTHDLLDDRPSGEPRYDVILVGDFFYEDTPAARTFAFLRRHAALGTRVLVGDPGRAYLPRERLEWLCQY